MHVQLSASAMGKQELFKECIAVLSDVCNYVAESDKRVRQLAELQEVCDLEAGRLKQLCAVLRSPNLANAITEYSISGIERQIKVETWYSVILLVQTRWLSLFPCLTAFIRAYGALVLFFREEATKGGTHSGKAFSFFTKLTEAETVLGFRAMHFLAETLHTLSLKLQEQAITYEEGFGAVEVLLLTREASLADDPEMYCVSPMQFVEFHDSPFA